MSRRCASQPPERVTSTRAWERASRPSLPGPPDDLSERELEILKLLALGFTTKEIAEQLYLSGRTVETHRSRVQEKLLLTSRADLVRYALDHNLVDT